MTIAAEVTGWWSLSRQGLGCPSLEPPSAGGTHLTGHLSGACPLWAGCSYLPRRAVGGLGAPGSAEGGALRASQVLCFFLSPQFPWWQLAPAPPAPGGLSNVPTETSVEGLVLTVLVMLL